jgi:sn-glycerol 3-phosphate transport system ATP-binding protein
MSTLNLLNITKNHGSTQVLNKINLNIEKGEFVVIVGPSGSGKTTILRLIAGLEKLCEGEIQINNQCVNHLSPANRDIAMVFQNYALYPHMTVYDNIAYGLRMRKVKKEIIKKKVTEVSAMLQLQDYLNRKPSDLSGGQKQRVAIGRALIRAPSIYLFDEPLSNLDAQLRGEMRREIKKLHRTLKITSVYITHDQTEAMTLADRIVVLNQGCIEQIGTPQELYQKPDSLFVASFLGSFPVNDIRGIVKLDKQCIETELDLQIPLLGEVPSSLNNQEVIVIIRPEHIKLDAENPHTKKMVEVVADMGHDLLLETQINEKKILVRGFEKFQVNQSVPLYFDWEKANFFCPRSGLRIRSLCA